MLLILILILFFREVNVTTQTRFINFRSCIVRCYKSDWVKIESESGGDHYNFSFEYNKTMYWFFCLNLIFEPQMQLLEFDYLYLKAP